MTEFLVEHAINNVWCSVEQDSQYIFKPAKISTSRGVKKEVKVEWSTISLPDSTNFYHVYQIGQLNPYILGLVIDDNQWHSAKELIDNKHIIINAYTDKGLNFPRASVFFRKTKTRNMIVAIMDTPYGKMIDNLRVNPIYIRFYSNAYFYSHRSHPTLDITKVDSIKVNVNQDIVTFKHTVDSLQSQYGGNFTLYNNGNMINVFNFITCKVGDVLEYQLDTTVKEVVDIKVEDLETFTSLIDLQNKYLVHPPKNDEGVINFYDDVDFYIYSKDTEGNSKGIFYHKAAANLVRMVTHRDYSIPVSAIMDAVNHNDEWNDPLQLYIKLKIRKSGFDRPLIDENQRIKELYKLSDDKIVKAMVGALATLPEWRAENLENSFYSFLMGCGFNDITLDVVETAYGYNAISKLIGNTPSIVSNINGTDGVKLPPGMITNSTVFEYTTDGKLIEWFSPFGEYFYTHFEYSKYVEVLHGMGSETTSTYYQDTPLTLPSNARFKCYVKSLLPESTWRIAEKDFEYEVISGVIQWKAPANDLLKAIRLDNNFLLKRMYLAPTAGVITFNITGKEIVDGVPTLMDIEIPYGKLDIFLNGYSLIENLDYYVSWPSVTIVNKEWYNPTAALQSIVIRASNFCQDNMNRIPVAEYGFIDHGLLSRNSRYDVRDDKVMRFIADGRLWSKEELLFSESDSGLYMENVRNGAPYQIDDIIVPIDNVTNLTTAEAIENSKAIDARVSDYLTMYYPEPSIDDPSIIPYRYKVISPLIARLIHDFRCGCFSPEGIDGQYSDSDISDWITPYKPLLLSEPIRNDIDSNHVIIHPHLGNVAVDLNIYQYNFIKRVIGLYLDNYIDVSPHITII